MSRVTANISLIYISSCVGCLLTVFIGNFGVSDAEVPILTRPQNKSHIVASSDDGANLKTTLFIPGPTTTDLLLSGSSWTQNKNSLLAKTPLHSVVTDSQDNHLPGQAYQNKRQKRDHFPPLNDDTDETDKYRTPLNQIITQAMTNPEEWSKLRKVFDEVDGDLKELLARDMEKSGTGRAVGGGDPINKKDLPDTRFDTQTENPDDHELSHLDHHSKWNFTYHRVHPLNSAGLPISRGIAAVVVSRDTIQSESVSPSKIDTSTVSSRANVRGTSVKVFHKMDTLSAAHGPSDHVIFSKSGEGASSRDSLMRSFSRFENPREHVDLAVKEKTSKIISTAAPSDSDMLFVKATNVVLPPLKPEVIQVNNNRHGSHYAPDGNKQSVTRTTQLLEEQEERDNFGEPYFLPPIRSRDHPHRHRHVQPNHYQHKLHKHQHHHLQLQQQQQQLHHWYQHKHFSSNANVQDTLDQPLEQSQPHPQKLTHHHHHSHRAEEKDGNNAEK